jgi:peptide/nickel transport system permease protein
MTSYIIRRLLQAVIVFFLVSFLVFILMRLLPGDPVLIYASQADVSSTSDEELEILKKEFGLDRPLMVQYGDWVFRAFQGDLGYSIMREETVASIIARVLPVTLHLGLQAFLISAIIGIPAGVTCAVRRGKWIDTGVTVFANIGITIPVFWLGILMIYLFGLHLGWLPIQGYTSPFENFSLSIRQEIMPVFCLTIFAVASTTRQTRSSMLEVIRQDYVRTAWSKGLKERSIIMQHTLKNGIIPVITLQGTSLRRIIGGSTLVETVFNIPGMGRLVVSALLDQDYAIVQGITLVITFVVVLANLAVDLAYGWLDPRIRYD